MEIKSSKPLIIDEVYNFVKNSELQTHTYISKSSIEDSICSYLETHYRLFTNKEKFKVFIEFISGLKLSQTEAMNIINYKPKSEVELSLIVSDYEDKLDQKSIEKIINFNIN